MFQGKLFTDVGLPHALHGNCVNVLLYENISEAGILLCFYLLGFVSGLAQNVITETLILACIYVPLQIG